MTRDKLRPVAAHFVGMGMLFTLAAAGCQKQQPALPAPATPPVPAEATTPVAQPAPAANPAPANPTPARFPVAEVAPPDYSRDKPTVPAQAAQQPLTPEQLAALKRRIASAASYPERIESRRVLMQALRRERRYDAVLGELIGLIDDVEKQDGPAMAERVAFAEGSTFQSQKDPRAAELAFGYLRDRFPHSRFAVEALYQTGLSQLDAREYDQAEKTLQQLIERHDDSPLAPWGWRKLALVQLLQNKISESLATLDVMAAKYKGSEFAEYAQMRRGYVQMAAGQRDAAKASYVAFLGAFPDSKYRNLVQQQLDELGRAAAPKQLGRVGAAQDKSHRASADGIALRP